MEFPALIRIFHSEFPIGISKEMSDEISQGFPRNLNLPNKNLY